MTGPQSREIPAVGAVVFDPEGRLLLIQRGNPPAQGQWSLPGGRVEAGESGEEAVVRELREETGLVGVVERHVGSIRRPAPGGGTYVIEDFLVKVPDADYLVAGDDALAADWFSTDELEAVDTSAGLVEILQDWGLIARPAE